MGLPSRFKIKRGEERKRDQKATSPLFVSHIAGSAYSRGAASCAKHFREIQVQCFSKPTEAALPLPIASAMTGLDITPSCCFVALGDGRAAW